MREERENVFEFLNNDAVAALTINQGRYKSRIKELKERYPDEVDYRENRDGSIFAHIPTAWLRINPGRELSEEAKEKATEHLRKLHNSVRENASESIFRP
jgi:hypothetical protein